MTLTTSCEKHVSKEVLSFFEKYFSYKAKYGMVAKKEYKTRCQKTKLEILSSMIYDSFSLELWYKHCAFLVDVK